MSMWQVARRPRWIGALILALAVAAAFAALGQWQLERSFASGDIVTRATETVVELDTIAEPQQPVSAAADGQKVRLEASIDPDDYIVLSSRINGDDEGFWVVGHLTSEGTDAGLAVALGWAASESDAEAAVAELEASPPSPGEWFGRYTFAEGPQGGDFSAGELASMSPAAFVNLWDFVDDGGTYGGFLVVDEPFAGLVDIDSPAPSGEISINWLNIFYAAEWAVFAGFAVFLWWRLVKDAWEEETEQARLN